MKVSYVLTALPALVSCGTLQERQYNNGLLPDTIEFCDIQAAANEISTCDTMAKLYKLSTAQFITYNKSLKPDCSGMKPGQFYCIHVSREPATLVKPIAPKPSPAPGAHYGEPANCSLWQKIFADDLNEYGQQKTCVEYAKGLGNLETLLKWNPDLKPDCSNLKVNTYICVRIPTTT